MARGWLTATAQRFVLPCSGTTAVRAIGFGARRRSIQFFCRWLAENEPQSLARVVAETPGLACTILGTTCLNGLVVDKPLFEPRDLGLLFTVPVVCG